MSREKRIVQVDRWEGPWIHASPVHVRMSKPWFEFPWPFEWSPKKETKEKLFSGFWGFSITWRVEKDKDDLNAKRDGETRCMH